MKRKPTIEELETILESDEASLIFIQPDGSLHTRRSKGSKLAKNAHNMLTKIIKNKDVLSSSSY